MPIHLPSVRLFISTKASFISQFRSHSTTNVTSLVSLVVKGYSVKLSGSALEDLTKRHDVEAIVEDTEVCPSGFGEEIGTPYELEDLEASPEDAPNSASSGTKGNSEGRTIRSVYALEI